MGYHVTILRTKDSVVVPMKLEEVQTAIQSLVNWQYIEKDNAFVKKGDDEESCVLWYENGELWAKTPSEWALRQMIALAVPLHARVRGDEFETYEAPEKWYTHPDDIKLKKEAEVASEALLSDHGKEQKMVRLVIIGVFIMLGAIGFIVGKSFEK